MKKGMTNICIDSLRPLRKANMRDVVVMQWPVGMKVMSYMSNTIKVDMKELE